MWCYTASIGGSQANIGNAAAAKTRPLQRPGEGTTLRRGACPVRKIEPGVGRRRRRTTNAEPDWVYRMHPCAD